MKIIGIDNGVTGTIGIIDIKTNQSLLYHTPIKKELSYTKKKQYISRIDRDKLRKILSPHKKDSIAYLERPMVNPGRFKATISAMRALEATLTVIEDLKIARKYIDSKEWQKVLLPSKLKGDELKTASLDIGKRLFPNISFDGFKDADALLIAEYGRRLYESI